MAINPGAGPGQLRALHEILSAIIDNGKLEAAGFHQLFELGKLQLAKLDQAIGKGGIGATPAPTGGKASKEEQPIGLWELVKTLLGRTQEKIDPQGKVNDARKGWEKTLEELGEQEKALADATAKAAALNAKVLEAVDRLDKAMGSVGELDARLGLQDVRGHRDRAEEAVDYEKEKRDALGKRVGEARKAYAGEQEEASKPVPKAPSKWDTLRKYLGQYDTWGKAFSGAGEGAAEGEAGAGAAEAGGAEAAGGAAGGVAGLAIMGGKKVLEKVKKSFDELGKAWGSEKFGDVGSHLAKSSEVVTGMFGKLAARGFESIEKLRKWNEELHESNMQFAEWSGAMAAVQARQEVRDILLSKQRGDNRAESAEALAKSKHDLNETLAPSEDMWAKFKAFNTTLVNMGVSNLLTKLLPGVELLGVIAGFGPDGEPGGHIGEQLEEAGKEEWSRAYGAKRKFGDLEDPFEGKK